MAGHNPVKGGDLDAPQIIKPKIIIPAIDDVRLVLARAKDMPRVLLHLAAVSGLRSGEIRALDWTNVGSDEAVIRVRKAMDRWNVIWNLLQKL